MLMLIRHALAILALPCTVTIVIPIWIARRNATVIDFPLTASELVLVLLGAILFGVGFVLFVASLYYFATKGRGTLAPWDPPRQLVVQGPYRFVRNPMISGVMFILVGEALLLRSRPHAGWAALFILINAVYIPLLEEPMLAARFGRSYEQYTKDVRRFVPRLRPWSQSRSQ